MEPIPYHDKDIQQDQIEIAIDLDEKAHPVAEENIAHPEMRRKLVELYGRKAEEDDIAPANDITVILERIVRLSDERAMEIVLAAINRHSDDPNFPSITREKLLRLSQGYKEAEMDPADWTFELRCEAALLHYHSPYPEVRSVCDPFDDPTIPIETVRAYFLGMMFMAGSTWVNTFFSPRQPAISLSGLVLQCLLAPCGQALAKILPNWGFTIWGRRISLNPGPWTFKEQIFASIMFTVGNGAGATYYTYLVQMLPEYLDQTWVTFAYELLLALYAQMAGFGFAGVLRRFIIYPSTAIWPSVLPTLALNRVLVTSSKKNEKVNGWTISKYKFFMLGFVAMFVWFWIPNNFFTALHLFNWMTWIAPHNFNLAMVTGSYGGLGINPWSTFDWNVSGSQALVTPWFSTAQQYLARLVSGVVLIAMYYGNYAWSAFMPMNSSEAFNNKGAVYNISKVMGDDGYVNVVAYKEYGPPYYPACNIFGQGNKPALYTLTISYVFVRYWPLLKGAAISLWRNFHFRSRPKGDVNNDLDLEVDPHARMMRAYIEVPDWWYMVILAISVACGIAALTAYPTHTPWWSLLAAMGIEWVMLVPSALLLAIANVGIGLDVMFKLLAGLWFPGNPEALIILEVIGPAFDTQTESYMSMQKLAHYAKLPPRAIFRGMMLAVFCNCLIFIGVLNWMVNSYNKDGSLCTWSNPEHFVCQGAVQDFSSAVMYGVLGTRNMYTLYPVIPWSMFIGTVLGISIAISQRYAPSLIARWKRSWREERFDWWNRKLFSPLGWVYWFNPPVFWSGANSTWSGGGNLSYHTNQMYFSFIFMYQIKRRYPAWFEKYNFLLEAAFDVGTAVSGTLQTLVFAFTGKSVPKWWGNTVAKAGVDYAAYNQKDPLYKLPKVGYFGLAPNEYPLKYPQSLLDGTKGARSR